MTVDPTESEFTREVGNDPPIGPDKIVTAAQIDTEVMVLDSAKDGLGQEGQAKLIVAARPVLAVVYAPTNPPGQEFGTDFITVGVTQNAKQITGLKRNFESWWIQRFSWG